MVPTAGNLEVRKYKACSYSLRNLYVVPPKLGILETLLGHSVVVFLTVIQGGLIQRGSKGKGGSWIVLLSQNNSGTSQGLFSHKGSQ